MDEKKANINASADSKLDQQMHNYLNDIISINKILNVIGFIATLMNIWFFIETISKMRSGDISAGLYFQSFVIVFFFLIFISLARYKLNDQSYFVMFMSSCYGVVLTLILIATYYISAEVVLTYGADFYIAETDSIDYFTSRSLLALFLYGSAFYGARYFITRSPEIVGRISAIPIFLMFVWLVYILVGQGRIISEFENGFDGKLIFGYIMICLMTLLLINFSSNALKIGDRKK